MQHIKDIPQSRKAEAAVVGSCLFNPSCIPLVMENCSLNEFIDNDYHICMEAIFDLWHSDSGIDAVIVRQWIEDKGKHNDTILDSIKVAVEGTPSSANAEYYAKIVREKAFERDLIAATEKLEKKIYDKGLTVVEKKELFEKAALELSFIQPSADAETVKDIAQKLWEYLQKPTKEAFVTTGFEGVDEKIDGFQEGEFIILAGRPSVGKSSMMLDMALNMSSQNIPTLIMSMEMNRNAIGERVLSNLTRIPLQRIRRLDLSDEEKIRIEKTINNLEFYKLFLDDSPPMSPYALSSKVMKAKLTYGIRCVFVDYLQLMNLPKMRTENRNQEITKICRELVTLAKRTKIPFVVLSQLSRAVTHREDPKPRLSDLRESGSIEQDADTVIFIYREKYDPQKAHKGYEPFMDGEDKKEKFIVRCYLAKSRQAKPGQVDVNWFPEYFSFREAIFDEEIPF